ncbi:MAG: hypothetical protein MN733_12070 [Nitrososphaera sp.]|nr:hypothetical protein [Nitrososphaera sp.]
MKKSVFVLFAALLGALLVSTGAYSAEVVNIKKSREMHWTHDRISTSGYELRVDCTDFEVQSSCVQMVDLELPVTDFVLFSSFSPSKVPVGFHKFALVAYADIGGVKEYSSASNVLDVHLVSLSSPILSTK